MEKELVKSNIIDENLKRETEIFPFGASTKGGQRANRKRVGIHLRHKPTGFEVKIIEERSRAQNLKIAFDRLKEKLEELYQPEIPRISTEVPAWAKKERLRQKKIHSQKKARRKKSDLEKEVNM